MSASGRFNIGFGKILAIALSTPQYILMILY